jgi:hypothetical protein
LQKNQTNFAKNTKLRKLMILLNGKFAASKTLLQAPTHSFIHSLPSKVHRSYKYSHLNCGNAGSAISHRCHPSSLAPADIGDALVSRTWGK